MAAAAAGGEVKTLSPPELLHTNQIQENRHRKWQEGCQHKALSFKFFKIKAFLPPDGSVWSYRTQQRYCIDMSSEYITVIIQVVQTQHENLNICLNTFKYSVWNISDTEAAATFDPQNIQTHWRVRRYFKFSAAPVLTFQRSINPVSHLFPLLQKSGNLI